MLFKAAHWIRSAVWRIVRPTTLGVKAILLFEDELCLVQTKYGANLWTLPGGAVRKYESVESAVRREAQEECGITRAKWRLVSVYHSHREGKNDYVALFEGLLSQKACRKGPEISRCEFFPLSALPRELSPATARRIEEFAAQTYHNGEW